ncbi:YceI family protein [Actinoplanes sp. NPDC020271]|uniref:YceI family protein n=1 Tax=Actinoplanes sp. NPDC020271 TaxID=3363896 RepID=UPI0037B22C42
MNAETSALPRRKRHWLRWTLAGVAALLVLLVAGAVAAVKLQPVPSPLTLPVNPAPSSGPLNGAYQPTTGSLAGFRIQQSFLGVTSEMVGRTPDITGTVTATGDRVTAASLRINLLALTSGGKKPAPQYNISLDTEHYPDATVTLTQPVALSQVATATGTLTLHGVTRTVTATMSIRQDGAGLDVAGSLPVAFADYRLAQPTGYGSLGSLADHGTAEFLLLLRRP